MLEVTVEPDRIRVGERFSVTFQRTLRIPEDSQVYPLPPGLGRFPVHRARDYGELVPEEWWRRDDVFLPIHQREALWLSFGAAYWKPNAVKVAVGRINALTGRLWDEHLHGAPQDYVVCPDQLWLDGINVGHGEIRQFVAMPLGSGYTVEGQVTGEERFGGIQILVFEPKQGLFPDQPSKGELSGVVAESVPPKRIADTMGIGAGGRIRQKIYPDLWGIDTWDQENSGAVFVHLVNSEQYRILTGIEPPPSPISARAYTDWGLPWFSLYDEERGDVPPSDVLACVKSVLDRDAEVGEPSTAADASADIPKAHVKTISPPPKRSGPEQ